MLFDLYRATGQQGKFEHLANDYAQQFGLSSPQWFSLPKLVAEAVQQELPFDEDGPLPTAKGAYQDIPGEQEEEQA